MSEPSEEVGKGSNWGRLADWLYTIDLPQGVKNQFGASGPELPQKCRVEGDRFLNYSTMLVYVSTAVAATVYALGYVKLTESIPVHMHLSPRIIPTIAMSHNEDFPWKPYAYCHNKDYDCPMKTWAMSPEGCAKIFKADMKHLPQLNTAAGDGVFLPTVWRYEEMSIKPTVSTITPTCDVNKTCTLSDRKDFCSCTERNESLFMPGIIEQQMTLVYQMHMEIPDLTVMAGGGVNTPMCEDFLIHDDEVKHHIQRANCTDDPHPLRCAMIHFDLSFIRCEVQLRSGGKLQGRNYNIKSSAQKIALNKHSFQTAWWGQWKVDLTNVLQKVTEVNETTKQHPNKEECEDPYICSFMSTGGSIMVHHFIDPVDPDEWSWRNPMESLLERLACRLGLPSRMLAFHNRTRRWPCFRLRVEIEYFPFQAVNKTDIVIHDAKTGAATLQRHQHRGIKAVVAQGGGGTVQRFTWTSFIVGLFSIFDLWVARMFIMECVILFCLCGTRKWAVPSSTDQEGVFGRDDEGMGLPDRLSFVDSWGRSGESGSFKTRQWRHWGVGDEDHDTLEERFPSWRASLQPSAAAGPEEARLWGACCGSLWRRLWTMVRFLKRRNKDLVKTSQTGMTGSSPMNPKEIWDPQISEQSSTSVPAAGMNLRTHPLPSPTEFQTLPLLQPSLSLRRRSVKDVWPVRTVSVMHVLPVWFATAIVVCHVRSWSHNDS